MDKVRIGIVGVGGMGTGHAITLQEIEEAQLTAVCDTDKATVEEASAKYGVRGFGDHMSLVQSGLADAVIIATPHYFHPPIAVDAFRAGLHVLSEKPIAVTVGAADEMIRAAKETGKVFVVMYQTRSSPMYQAARKLVEEGRLGEIYRTCLTFPDYRSQAYYDSATWRATWKGEGGGMMLNQAPHPIDVFTWLGGMPNRVTARTATRRHRIEVEDEASALLEYANGATGFLHASVNEVPGGVLMEFAGEKGKLSIHKETLRFWSLAEPIQAFTETTGEMWATLKATEEEVPIAEGKAHHGVIIRNFCRAILFGEARLTPGEEGIRSLELINAILLSGAKRKPVDLPLDRAEYEAFIEGKKRSSKGKKLAGPVKRVTDPTHMKKK